MTAPPTLPLIPTASEIEREVARYRRLHPHARPDAKVIGWSQAGGLLGIGLFVDGSFRNPHRYPEDRVRAAIERLLADRRQGREDAIAKGVETRRQRHDDQLWRAVKAWKAGTLEPGHNCRICGKALTDPPSLERGIRPECWDRVLTFERITEGRLLAQGIKRVETLHKIAALRARLVAHAAEFKDRRAAEIFAARQVDFARIAERRRETSSPEDFARWSAEFNPDDRAKLLRHGAEVSARSEYDARIRTLERLEDRLGSGAATLEDVAELDRLISITSITSIISAEIGS
jgi:hypothetical protein